MDIPPFALTLEGLPDDLRILAKHASRVLVSRGALEWRADDLAIQAVSDLMRRAKIAAEQGQPIQS